VKKALTHIRSTAVPLDTENIDTDQILPARYLKATTRDGFGEKLFRDLRFDSSGHPIPGFVLNNPAYSGEILIAGHNFGGGSSREHAAWALADFGFTAVVSSFFGDIFKSNALANSLLPVEVPPPFLRQLFEVTARDPGCDIEISVGHQTISVPSRNLNQTFEIQPYKKICLMNGYDDIDYLVSMQRQIVIYENSRKDDY
jgi:3-isopropylmalate/(R)-2-methylmalate dehydratase small subunit